MIDPAVVLFMLREGPRRPLVLAQWLAVSKAELRPVLFQLQKSGKIRRLSDNRVAIAGYRTIHERFAAAAATPGAEPPSPKRGRPTRIVDGVVYEVVDYESLLRKRDWPRGGSSLSGYEMGLSVRR